MVDAPPEVVVEVGGPLHQVESHFQVGSLLPRAASGGELRRAESIEGLKKPYQGMV